MQLGASQANQGTPPFWRGRLLTNKNRFDSKPSASCLLMFILEIEKDEAERSNGEA